MTILDERVGWLVRRERLPYDLAVREDLIVVVDFLEPPPAEPDHGGVRIWHHRDDHVPVCEMELSDSAVHTCAIGRRSWLLEPAPPESVVSPGSFMPVRGSGSWAVLGHAVALADHFRG